MNGVTSWLDVTESDLEREIERLHAEIHALCALWKTPDPSGLASARESEEGRPEWRRNETEQ